MTRKRQIQQSSRKSGVTLIGLGNWGTALAHALANAGIPVREIVVRKGSASAKQTAEAVSAELTTWKHARFDAPVLWFCTPDAQIQPISEALAVRKSTALRGVKVLHSSGVLSSAVLQAVANHGASIASVHPMMSFPQRAIVPLHNVPFGVEGDAPAVRTATAWIRKMGGDTFHISTGQKALYHAFGTFSSPLLVAFLTAARTTGLRAGLSTREIDRRMRPIVERSVRNFFEHGADRSFSGPIARGDVATIHLHLAALEKHPKLERVYKSVAEYALDALPAKKRRQLRQALRGKAFGAEK